MKRFVSVAAVLSTLLCGAPAMAQSAYDEIKVEAGEKLFDAECHRCHAPNAEDPSYGPPLKNVVGRGAGTFPDYDYSVALEASGIVWTPAALKAWMEDNTGFMPGTKMRHVGIADPVVQEFILAYLQSISDRDPKEISK